MAGNGGFGGSKWANYGPLLIKVEPIYLKQNWVLQFSQQ